ncbi:translation initiation factor IF-2-like isoform X2 [Dermacentor silvarum]|uniref:translation initiation factor IF-2-like isoform X2 n=1 Tax=Dermacentor silvarum TaxID=543639 RepID=UPI00210079D6|nr:translation initiation factor IF-2-like isoform X2 [Dermacentor silvarum]
MPDSHRCHLCERGGGDLTEAQDFIKRWLPGSVDRGGGRKRRFAETLAAEKPDDPSLQGRNHCLPTAALSLPHPCPQVPGKSTVGPSCPAAAAPAPSPAAAPAPAIPAAPAPPPAATPGAEHPY